MKVRIERHYRLEVEVPDDWTGDAIFNLYDPQGRDGWDYAEWRETHRTITPLPEREPS